MRKILIGVLSLFTVSAFAQKTELGFQAGYISSTFFNSDDYLVNTSAISSYQVGATADFKLNQHFYFQTGLSWIQKGAQKLRNFQAPTGESTTIKINYLELPANLAYKFKLNKDLKGFLGFGLYLAGGISGNDVGSALTSSGTIAVNRKVQFTTSESYSSSYTSVNPFELGYDAFGGIEYKHFVAKLSYTKGISKVETAPVKQYQNQTYGISVGYEWDLK